MSRYRWLRPLKCAETMSQFPSLKEHDFEQLERLLHSAVERGDVRILMNDVEIPSVQVGSWLALYARACPDQPAWTLPPDILLSYDDLCKVFDRPNIDARKRGRPAKERSGWDEDRHHAHTIHRMLASANPKAKSAAEAARLLVATGTVSGHGTKESIAKRLERAFRKYYSSG